jgi:uncharacterized small protein (TIGR04563 family)
VPIRKIGHKVQQETIMDYEVDQTAFETPRKHRAQRTIARQPATMPKAAAFKSLYDEEMDRRYDEGMARAAADTFKKQDPVRDMRKQSVYLPTEILKEMHAEALRQDRSLSWIVQMTWRLARTKVALFPGVPGR